MVDRGILLVLTHYKRIVFIVLQGQASATHHAFQRIVGHVYRQLDLLAKPFVQSTEQGATTSEVQTAAVDIGSQLGRRHFQGFEDGFFDLEDAFIRVLPQFPGS